MQVLAQSKYSDSEISVPIFNGECFDGDTHILESIQKYFSLTKIVFERSQSLYY